MIEPQWVHAPFVPQWGMVLRIEGVPGGVVLWITTLWNVTFSQKLLFGRFWVVKLGESVAGAEL